MNTTTSIGVTIGILCYNHQNYIVQALDSVLHQKGNYHFNVFIFDDCSTDGSVAAIQRFLEETPLPQNISVTLVPSKTNLGMVKNFEKMIKTCAAQSNPYTTFLDGDDYWYSDLRVQKHIAFLNAHPQCPFSFNALLQSGDDDRAWWMYEAQVNYDYDTVLAKELAEENIIGNLGCSFLRTEEILPHLKDEMFEIFFGDWMFHLAVAAGREIGFIHEPLSVYRKTPSGIWAGTREKKRVSILTTAVPAFDKITGGIYKKPLERYLSKITGNPMPDEKIQADLIIIDDIYPHPGSGFRRAEFGAYLEAFPKTHIFTNALNIHILGEMGIRKILDDFLQAHPQYRERISYIDVMPHNFTAKMAYFCFLGNAWQALETLEENRVPFMFELYPGGSFALNDSESDVRLQAVTSSPYFLKVITTQPVTTRYLLEKGFCTKDQIVEIFGVATPEEVLKPYTLQKQCFGFEKNRLDIVFSAFKYSPTGRDKGYDIFVETAHLLYAKYQEVYFHVVGGFDENVLDVSALQGHISFYGAKPAAWFDTFYQDKDIIISPNIPFILSPGAFDGFPTASCTEAALRDVAIFATDPLDMNEGRFKNHEEIELILPDASFIAERIGYYWEHPAQLKALAFSGRQAVQTIYGRENQISPRIDLIQEMLEKQDAKLGADDKEKYVPFTAALRWVDDNQKPHELRKKFFWRNLKQAFELTFALEEPLTAKEFNIVLADPGTLILQIEEVAADGKPLDVYLHNGVEIDDTLYFTHLSPQIYCKKEAGTENATSEDAFLTIQTVTLRGTAPFCSTDETAVATVAWALKQKLLQKEWEREQEAQKKQNELALLRSSLKMRLIQAAKLLLNR